MNESNLPQEQPTRSKFSFLTEIEMLELRGMSAAEYFAIRDQVRLADPVNYDIFSISTAIPLLGETGSASRDEQDEVGKILIAMVNAIVAEGRIMRPISVLSAMGRVHCVYAFDVRKVAPPQLLILRKALAGKISDAVEAFADEIAEARQKGPQGPKAFFG